MRSLVFFLLLVERGRRRLIAQLRVCADERRDELGCKMLASSFLQNVAGGERAAGGVINLSAALACNVAVLQCRSFWILGR